MKATGDKASATLFVRPLTIFRSAGISLLVFLSLSIAQATDTEKQEAFNKVYAEYQSLVDAGNIRDAVNAAKEALEMGKGLYAPESKGTAALNYNYAYALKQVGDNDAAKKAYKQTLGLYKDIYGKDSVRLIDIYMDLGDVSSEVFDAGLQRKHFNRALKIAEEKYGDDSLAYARLSERAGISILEQSRSLRSEIYLKNAYKIFSDKPNTDNELAVAAFYLGKVNLSRRAYDDAVANFQVALPLFEKSGGMVNQKMVLTIHAFLVQAYEELDKSDQATEHCLAIGNMQPFDVNQEYMPVYRMSPRYPSVAQQRGQEGQVLVSYTVDASGFVRNPVVEESAGSKVFHDPALEVVRDFRYAPRFIDGKPVATDGVQHIITFRLTD